MPILYVIAACFFFVTYWVDKYMMIKWYQKPLINDEFLSLGTVPYIRLAVVFHLLGSFMMMSNQKILPKSTADLEEWLGFDTKTLKTQFGDFGSPEMLIYLTSICLLVLIAFLSTVLSRVVFYISSKFGFVCTLFRWGRVSHENSEVTQTCFYQSVKFSTLLETYNYAVKELSEIQDAFK
jgi:hypothetical protein